MRGRMIWMLIPAVGLTACYKSAANRSVSFKRTGQRVQAGRHSRRRRGSPFIRHAADVEGSSRAVDQSRTRHESRVRSLGSRRDHGVSHKRRHPRTLIAARASTYSVFFYRDMTMRCGVAGQRAVNVAQGGRLPP
jgi:hypothetical protein